MLLATHKCTTTRSCTKQEAIPNEHAGQRQIALYTRVCTTTRLHTKQEAFANEHAGKHKIALYTRKCTTHAHIPSRKLLLMSMQESTKLHCTRANARHTLTYQAGSFC